MEEKLYEEKKDVDITKQNKFILQFCSSILCQYQEVLDDREKIICQQLLEGRSKEWVAKTLFLSNERVRQIFHKSIKKISAAHEDDLQKLEKITQENEELRHRNFYLENEVMTAQMREKVNGLLDKEQSLCLNAIRLLDVPVRFLCLSARAINVLESANVLTFKEIPVLTTEQLYRINNCGSKTIFDIKEYLSKFSLKLGMLYEDVITQLAKLSNDDISPENFGNYRVQRTTPVIIRPVPVEEKLEDITLSQFCAEMGRGKKSKKKWGGKVKRILIANQIDTLEKFLAMKPYEFKALNGVGPTTLKYAQMAFDHFGLAWREK